MIYIYIYLNCSQIWRKTHKFNLLLNATKSPHKRTCMAMDCSWALLCTVAMSPTASPMSRFMRRMGMVIISTTTMTWVVKFRWSVSTLSSSSGRMKYSFHPISPSSTLIIVMYATIGVLKAPPIFIEKITDSLYRTGLDKSGMVCLET